MNAALWVLDVLVFLVLGALFNIDQRLRLIASWVTRLTLALEALNKTAESASSKTSAVIGESIVVAAKHTADTIVGQVLSLMPQGRH